MQIMQLPRYKLRCATKQHTHNLQPNRHNSTIKVSLYASIADANNATTKIQTQMCNKTTYTQPTTK